MSKNRLMIKNSSQFLLHAIFGVLISFGVLIAAERFGFWKKKWTAEHKIIEYDSLISVEKLFRSPRYPSPILKINVSTFGNSQKLPDTYLQDKAPNIDKKNVFFQTLKLTQSDFSGEISIQIFEDKLIESKFLYPTCPSQKAVYWTECYGVYDFPWGEIYSGLWGEDKLNGAGKLRKENGNLYLGEFLNNQYNGCGILVETDGTTKSGVWQDGKLVEATKLCNIEATD